MSWLKIHDGWRNHPKVTSIGMAARGVWVTCANYCAEQLTDGHISVKQIRREGGRTRDVTELVDAGLWEVCTEHPDCIRFHDWADHQDTRNSVLEKRQNAAARKAKSRAAKRESGSSSARVRLESGSSSAQPWRESGSSSANETPPDQHIDPNVTRDPHARARTQSNPIHKNYYSPDASTSLQVTREAQPTTTDLAPTHLRGIRDLNATACSPAAAEVARGYAAWANGGIDTRTQTEIAREVDPLLADGIDPHQIAAGIKTWHASDSWAPSQLRRFIAKAAPTRDNPPLTKATRKAADTLTAAEAIIADLRKDQPA